MHADTWPQQQSGQQQAAEKPMQTHLPYPGAAAVTQHAFKGLWITLKGQADCFARKQDVHRLAKRKTAQDRQPNTQLVCLDPSILFPSIENHQGSIFKAAVIWLCPSGQI
jgi:hypothetical protein